MYSSTNIVRLLNVGDRCAGHVARMEDGRNAFKIMIGKPMDKRHRLEDNIRINLIQIGIKRMN